MASEKFTDNDRLYFVSFFLRTGLALVFFYASIASFLNPDAWVGYIPQFVQQLIPPRIFLHIHSAGEVFLALWLLSNKKTFYAAILSALALFAIIIFNVGALEIVFRDVTIMFAALALAVLSYGKR